jgi:formate--tetrahydrofolate ligase
LYDDNISIKEKIEKIVLEIYGWIWVDYSEKALENINQLTKLWFWELPVCIAKTPYSFSDNPKLLWRPCWFKVNVNEVKVSSGAWFIVVICGEVMTMPWLSKVPNATKIDINKNGVISWLS